MIKGSKHVGAFEMF